MENLSHCIGTKTDSSVITAKESNKTRVSTYIECPRWNDIEKFLFDMCVDLNIKLDITNVDKGFIRKTIYFSLEGEIGQLIKANNTLKKLSE